MTQSRILCMLAGALACLLLPPPGWAQLSPLCAMTAADNTLLGEIDAEIHAGWQQPVTLRADEDPGARLLSRGKRPLGCSLLPGSSKPVCRFPVQVSIAADGGCVATLPFSRLCIDKINGHRPDQVEFFIADERGQPRPPGDRIVFLNGGDDAPLFGRESGVYPHRRDGAGHRTSMTTGPHFTSKPVAIDGLSHVWAVGTQNTLGGIGDSRNGILAAALVKRIDGSGATLAICRPQDPIVVNLAN